MKPILFLGGGRITGALLAGLRLAGDQSPILVYDRNAEKLRALRRKSQAEIAGDLRSALARASMTIVAVRPGSVRGLLAEVTRCRVWPRLCVSLAAGVPLQILRQGLGPSVRWVRAMPSPVSRIGRGLTGLCFDQDASRAERTRVRKFFAVVGQVIEIPEPQFDAFTATYSSSHGYHALAALTTAAQDAGLDAHTALIASAHALGDAILYWRESGESLKNLLHEAATPGGIAAATMKAMDSGGYVRAVGRGLSAGIKTARANARHRNI